MLIYDHRWWLNLACAARDGIVKSTKDEITRGTQRQARTLPLLTGREIQGSSPDAVRYIKEGPQSAIHTSLLLDIGRTIKILRGESLKSKWAPTAGIRFDGL